MTEVTILLALMTISVLERAVTVNQPWLRRSAFHTEASTHLAHEEEAVSVEFKS